MFPLFCYGRSADVCLDFDPSELVQRLQDARFQDCLVAYLETLIKLDFTWSDSPDETFILGHLTDFHPGESFPTYHPGRDDAQWQQDFLTDAKSVALSYQIHRHTSTCHKKGTACRFHFDGPGKALYRETTIDLEMGRIELRRAHPMVNNHNPALASVIRANHDITAIFTSSLKRLQSMYYITTYVAKGEDDVSDIIAMTDSFRTLERSGILPNDDMVEQTRRLMIRMNYLRQSGRQFSGAQVAAMLLNIGRDGIHYTSSLFTRLCVFQFIRYLKSQSFDGIYLRVPAYGEDGSDVRSERDTEEDFVMGDKHNDFVTLPSEGGSDPTSTPQNFDGGTSPVSSQNH
jgi:hypothetical protein